MPRYINIKVFGPILLGTLVLFLAACAEEATRPTTPNQPTTPPSVPSPVASMWNKFPGNTETECADGSDYAYYVYPGTVNKLVIDFQGGGACWDDETCSLPIDEPATPGAYNSRVFGEPAPRGIYDKTREDNPTKDWYHAFISYCTADIHIGNSTQTYTNTTSGEEFSVQHKGQVNAQAVLDWIYSEFRAPETILMTGCSAGAYGSISYLPQVRERYPDAAIYQLGDSGAGVTPEVFFSGEDGINHWNTQSVLAELIPELDLSGGLNPTFITNIYELAGAQNPGGIVSQYNSAADGIQILFYALQQGAAFLPSQQEFQQAAQGWIPGLRASLGLIAADTDNFYSYVSELEDNDNPDDGTAHCIINRPEFYSYELNGTSFASWFEDLINGRKDALKNVAPEPSEATAVSLN